MMTKRLAFSLILALIPAFGLVEGDDKPSGPVPRPDLSPVEVVEIQLKALQNVDKPAKDAGIVTTFQFASPGNRQMTGPIERFTLLVKSPGYQPLLKHRIAGFGQYVQHGDLALQWVRVIGADGKAYDYEFQLSRDPQTRCWYTDGVVPTEEKAPPDPNKIVQATQSPSIQQGVHRLHPLSVVLSSQPD